MIEFFIGRLVNCYPVTTAILSLAVAFILNEMAAELFLVLVHGISTNLLMSNTPSSIF